MDRKTRIREKFTKVGLAKGHLTETELDNIISEYASGRGKRFKVSSLNER
jgi:hypothetical protein